MKNPTEVSFTCIDHDKDDNHEVDIIDSTGTVVQTLLIGDPPVGSDGRVVAKFNVQPINFGQYTVIVRAIQGALKSENSLPSEKWERSFGTPSNVQVK